MPERESPARLIVALSAALLAGALGCTGKPAEDAKGRSRSAPVLVKGVDSFDKLKALHEEKGKTAEGALHVWFVALYQYTSRNLDEYERGREGLSYLTIAFKDEKNKDWEGLNSYRTFVERCEKYPHIFRSYAKGSSPQNGYRMDPSDFELTIDRIGTKDSRGTQVYLRSSGADNPRPVYMKQSTQTGLWYVNQFDNVYLDVKKVVDPSKETFE